MTSATRTPGHTRRRLALTAAIGVAAIVGVGAPAITSASRSRPATMHEISFTVDGTTTYGTLTIPAHRPRQNMPAALLLPGSGPTDRNGDQPPALTPHTLTKIADVLADEGVASLRFDKYGTGRTGLGAYAEQPTTIDYPAFVRQAGAAYQLLADRPEVDRRALFLNARTSRNRSASVRGADGDATEGLSPAAIDALHRFVRQSRR